MPVRKSNPKHFHTDRKNLYLWNLLVVTSHNYCAVTRMFASNMIHLIDVLEQAQVITRTFPERVVQLEAEYFILNGVKASWVLVVLDLLAVVVHTGRWHVNLRH